MDAIIRFILHLSTLEVTMAKISQATKEDADIVIDASSTFVLSMDAQIKGTGPFPATIHPMEVNICYQGSPFAKLALPAVKVGFQGARISIQEQTVRILDMGVFERFIVVIVREDHFTLSLKNGDCSIKSFGMSGRCTFEKDIVLNGMNGLSTRIKDTTQNTIGFTMINPSPIEIDHGVTMLDIRDGKETIAKLKGMLVIKQGQTEVNMDITREPHRANMLTPQSVVLAGTGTEAVAWTDRTVQSLQTSFTADEKFFSFFMD